MDRKQFEKELKEKFPNLFALLGDEKSLQPITMFGIECYRGWYDLIWRTSEKLEGMGVQAVQIKSKYGELRYYLEPYNKEAEDIVSKACDESIKTCEECGAPGRLSSSDRGWVTTLCEAHLGDNYFLSE